MAENNDDTAFDIGMFVVLAFVVMGYFAAIGPAYAGLSAILPIPAVMAPLAPVMVAFMLITMVGAIGTPLVKAAKKVYDKRIDDEIEQGQDEFTYADAENQLREVFETTLDKSEKNADIINTKVGEDSEEIDVTFAVRSGREYVDTFSISGNENWDETNPVAVLFEYLEAAPPTDYHDLALADKEVFIRTSSYSDSEFTLDIEKMRDELPPSAFSFDQTDTLVELENETEQETTDSVDVEREVMTE